MGGDALPAAAKDDLNVVDVEVREVGCAAQASKKPAQTLKYNPVGQLIIDSHAGTGTLEYKLYIPPASFIEPLSLVVMLHGYNQDRNHFAACTGKVGTLA